MPGRYLPAFVASYEPGSGLARVRIPGLTDGAEVFPLAELCYPIGHRSEDSELLIRAGDRVWVDLINDDPRFPIIVGFRPMQTGNRVGVTRIEQDAVEIVATGNVQVLSAGLRHNSKNVGDTHVHPGVQSGGASTAPPAG
jgi:hypothetical protein